MTLHTEVKKKVPKCLVYEMDNGVPIYYKGYKAILNHSQNTTEKMPDSSLQAWLKGRLFFLISLFLESNRAYLATVGEQGLSLQKKSWRGADIAIFNKKNFVLNGEYSKLPPDVVIEIDVKGHYDSDEKLLLDFDRKNAQLLRFGVKKVIWIFTESKTLLTVDPSGRTQYQWAENVPVMEGITINIQKVIDDFFGRQTTLQ